MTEHHFTCDEFETHLGDFLEGALDGARRQECEEHQRTCPSCAALVRDLEQVVTAARALPLPSPTRDLWPAIEARLEPAVFTLPVRTSTTGRPDISWRRLSVAAAILVTLSAGVSWNVARRTPANAPVASSTLATSDGAAGDFTTDTIGDAAGATLLAVGDSNGAVRSLPVAAAASNGVSTPVRAVSNPTRFFAIDTLYGQEIALLRTVAEEQLGLLDSGTVNIVRRNLDIIDQAILESRAALERDPNSGFLLDQLDRAYERKVDLLRRLALL